MSEVNFFHEIRIVEELLTLIIEGRLYVSDFIAKYEYSKRTIRRDIKMFKDMFCDKYGEDASIVYNYKDDCYELLILKGSISIIDLPYGF